MRMLLIVLVFLILALSVTAYPPVMVGNEKVSFPMSVYSGGVITPVPGPIFIPTMGKSCGPPDVVLCVYIIL